MKATELRLGNLIETFSKKGNRIQPVQGIYPMADYVEISTESCFGTEDDYKPIQLTEEWLERFGFIQTGRWFELNVHNFIISIANQSENTWVCNLERGGMKETVLIPAFVNYVHTLQNLYFALTGEELELKK